MKIVCIEGLDGVGKEAVARKIVDIINKAGHKAEYVDFPQYESPSGILINELLHGYVGDMPSLDGNLIGSVYTLDRIHWFRENLEKKIETLDYLVLDRGFYSNFMYQASKLYHNRTWYNDISNWLLSNYSWEFVLTGLSSIKDIKTAVLTIGEKERQKMITMRAKSSNALDANESNYLYLDKVAAFFYAMTKSQTQNSYQMLTNTMIDLVNDTETVFNVCDHYFHHVQEVVVKRANLKVVDNDDTEAIEYNNKLLQHSIRSNALKVITTLGVDKDIWSNQESDIHEMNINEMR